jgi:pimeloyl-ACP methyl ester carboxylesterase
MMSQASPAQKAELQESNSSGNALAKALPLPKVPTVLLTGTLKDPSFPGNPLEQDLKLELQNELLAKLPDAQHVLVPNSRHYIQEDAPDLVINAIREVINGAEGSRASGGKS